MTLRRPVLFRDSDRWTRPALATRLEARGSLFPPLFLGAELFNFVEGVFFAAVDAGAFDGGDVPHLGGGEVVVPEGPGPALVGADGVDGAAALAGFAGGEEDAVFGGGVLEDAVAGADAFEVFLADVLGGGAEVGGQTLDLFAAYPDVAFVRAGAAVAAAGAFKMQAGGIPSFF